jgi:hypothetical protein
MLGRSLPRDSGNLIEHTGRAQDEQRFQSLRPKLRAVSPDLRMARLKVTELEWVK